MDNSYFNIPDQDTQGDDYENLNLSYQISQGYDNQRAIQQSSSRPEGYIHCPLCLEWVPPECHNCAFNRNQKGLPEPSSKALKAMEKKFKRREKQIKEERRRQDKEREAAIKEAEKEREAAIKEAEKEREAAIKEAEKERKKQQKGGGKGGEEAGEGGEGGQKATEESRGKQSERRRCGAAA